MPRSETADLRSLQAFARQLIQEIDLAHEELATFHNQDRPAYCSWYELNFRSHHDKIEALERDHARLVDIHNAMVALTKIKKISMPRAFAFLQKERCAYINGQNAQRRKIEDDRLKRRQFIECDHRVMQDPVAPKPEIVIEDEHPLFPSIPKQTLKFYYRRLVRLLHPDAQASSQNGLSDNPWKEKLWHLAQLARDRSNTHLLQHLYHLSLIRLGEFSKLSAEDLQSVCQVLKQDLLKLANHLQIIRHDPGYRFASQDNHDRIHDSIAEKLKRRHSSLVKEIHNLKGQHALLEVLSHAEQLKKRPRRKQRHLAETAQLTLFD